MPLPVAKALLGGHGLVPCRADDLRAIVATIDSVRFAIVAEVVVNLLHLAEAIELLLRHDGVFVYPFPACHCLGSFVQGLAAHGADEQPA